MKYVIDIKTAVALHTQCMGLANEFAYEAADDLTNYQPVSVSFEEALTAVIAETAPLANVSVRIEGHEIVYEVNDEVFMRFMGVYTKIARLVVPFVKPIKALFSALEKDFAEIAKMLSQTR